MLTARSLLIQRHSTDNGLLSRVSQTLHSPKAGPVALPSSPNPPPSIPLPISDDILSIDAQITALESGAQDPLLVETLPHSPHASASILFHGRLLFGVLVVAAAALMGSTLTESAKMRFYCFLVFEGTVGLYCESLPTGHG